MTFNIVLFHHYIEQSHLFPDEFPVSIDNSLATPSSMAYLQVSTLGINGYKSQHESTAHIIPAGSTPLGHELSTKDALTWTNQRPSTPEELRRYRKSAVNEPGQITRHRGNFNDPIPKGPFGQKSKQGESAAASMKQLPDSQVQQWRDAKKEEIYASSTREPLGSGFVRGHVLPEVWISMDKCHSSRRSIRWE